MTCMHVGVAAFCLMGSVMVAHRLSAKIVSSEDPNVLWVENGHPAEVGEGRSTAHWTGPLTLDSGTDPQTLVVRGSGADRTITREVPVDVNYPYVQFTVDQVQPAGGYKGFYLGFPGVEGVPKFRFAGTMPLGHYAWRALPQTLKRTRQLNLRMDVANLTVHLKGLSLVKSPPNYIELNSGNSAPVKPGDPVSVRVVLAQPAQDVSVTCYDSYTFKRLSLDGQERFDLVASDGVGRVWEGQIPWINVTNHRLKSKDKQRFRPGRLMIGATVLGGGVQLPLWTINSQSFLVATSSN